MGNFGIFLTSKMALFHVVFELNFYKKNIGKKIFTEIRNEKNY